MHSKVDKEVLEMLAKIKQQSEEIQKAKNTRPQWKTHCSYPLDGTNKINIMTVKDFDSLIQVYVLLEVTQHFWENANRDLGLQTEPKVANFSVSDWKDDIKTRVEMLKHEAKVKKFKELDARINSLVSVEQRRVLELEALKKELKD